MVTIFFVESACWLVRVLGLKDYFDILKRFRKFERSTKFGDFFLVKINVWLTD